MKQICVERATKDDPWNLQHKFHYKKKKEKKKKPYIEILI